jgi:Carbohydrate binding domain.
MAVTRKNFFQLTALHAALAFSAAVSAGTVVVKPGTYVGNSEFGSAVARSGNYTLVGAFQETVAIPGEDILNGGSDGQGVVYLFNGTNANPERRYQFAGNNHFYKRAGAKVALSNKWLAFGASEAAGSNTDKKSAVYVVGKVNSQWPECPTLNGILTCDSLVKANGSAGSAPIVKIEFPGYVHSADISLAISDDYLVMADQATSQVFIYRYDVAQARWNQEFATPADASGNRLGASVAIDGDRVAVSAPGFALTNGIVYVYKRSASGVWNISGAADGNVFGRNFGHKLDMHSGNLVIASGDYDGDQHLTFFRVNADGGLFGQSSVEVGKSIYQVTVDGDTIAYTSGDLDEPLKVIKRNATTNEWRTTTALNRYLYLNPHNGNLAYSATDPIDLSGDNLALGWRAYNTNGGAIIHEKISQIDPCKSAHNLVANCSFDNSGNGWQFLNHMGASSWADYSGGQLKATIYNSGSVHWHIQARTAVNLNDGGVYQLRFRAKADSYRSVTANIGHNGNQDNNWVSYGQTSFSVGPQWEEYSYEFYGVPSDANAFLDINLGNAGTSAVTIDGVSLISLDM